VEAKDGGTGDEELSRPGGGPRSLGVSPGRELQVIGGGGGDIEKRDKGKKKKRNMGPNDLVSKNDEGRY